MISKTKTHKSLDTLMPKFKMQGPDLQLKTEATEWAHHLDNLLHQEEETHTPETHMQKPETEDNLQVTEDQTEDNHHQGNHSDQEQVILH